MLPNQVAPASEEEPEKDPAAHKGPAADDALGGPALDALVATLEVREATTATDASVLPQASAPGLASVRSKKGGDKLILALNEKVEHVPLDGGDVASFAVLPGWLVSRMSWDDPKLVLFCLELPEAPFVIHLMPALPWTHGAPGLGRDLVLALHANGQDDADAVLLKEQEVDAFLQETLIPFAVQTGALVLLHGSGPGAAVAHSLMRLVAAASKRWGPQAPPFSTVCLADGVELAHAATTPGTHAHELYSASAKAGPLLAEATIAASAAFGPQRVHWPCQDLPRGCGQYLVINAVESTRGAPLGTFALQAILASACNHPPQAICVGIPRVCDRVPRAWARDHVRHCGSRVAVGAAGRACAEPCR